MLRSITVFHKVFQVRYSLTIFKHISNGLDLMDLTVVLLTVIWDHLELKSVGLLEVKKRQEAEENQDLTLGNSI